MGRMVVTLFFVLAMIILKTQGKDGDTLLKRTWRGKSKRAKKMRLKRLLDEIRSGSGNGIPKWFAPATWSAKHSASSKYAVLTAALGDSYYARDGLMFCGTLRETGYDGDIVVAVQPDAQKSLLQQLRKCRAIVYVVGKSCVGVDPDLKCTLKDPNGSMIVNSPVNGFSPNVIRYQLYQWWLLQSYNHPHIQIMVADFADVFFQRNPFTYKTWEWSLPQYHLALFQEPFPNKIISRCPFNSGWISACYGEEELRRVGANPVICSGIVMGTRDALLSYTGLVIAHLDPRVRRGDAAATTGGKDKCASLGMDQGLTNWLAYSGLLERYLSVKLMPQGEGPVNTIGGHVQGHRSVIKMSLRDWHVIREARDGSSSSKSIEITNWNGDLSPCVHQADRFVGQDLAYEDLKAFRAANRHQNVSS